MAQAIAGLVPDTGLPDSDSRSAATAGQVLALNAEKTGYVLADDQTSSGGSGLDASGVRGQVQSQLEAGNGISLTPSGSGATRTLEIAATATGAPTLSSPTISTDLVSVVPSDGGTSANETLFTFATTTTSTDGNVIFNINVHGTTDDAISGGDRVYPTFELTRTPTGGSLSVIATLMPYVRNANNFGGTLTATTQIASGNLVRVYNAVVGDAYTVRWRVGGQNQRTVTLDSDQTTASMLSW